MKKFICLLLTLPALVLALSSGQFNFLSISDVHLNTEQTHIMQINPAGYDAKNDMDYDSFDKLMTAVKNTHSSIIENDEWIIQNYTTYQIHDNKLSFSKYYDFFTTYCQASNHTKKINDCLYSINFDDTLPQYTVNNPNYSNYPAKSSNAFFVRLKNPIVTIQLES